ncbi:unnamed protein product [Clonostachys byssicola]|uniref:Dipeptidase n=1 Tax=Clonostachys byssicola TaxID=160290 RepID=A0A9N9Y197_9HYPO|nr:unnamed protein product [Clonostachys byssicola]
MSDTSAHAELPPEERSADSSTQNDTAASESRALVVRNRGQNGFSKYFYSGILGLFAVSISLFSRVLPFTPQLRADDYMGRTRQVLSTTPLIDGHNDLPYVIRQELKNKIYNPRFDFRGHLLSHTDLGKMRSGQMGGQFWSVFVECKSDGVPQLDDPTWVVRDTLEQIDVVGRLIAKHPNDLQFCGDAACVRSAFASGKIASMIGIEGSHQIGNSIATLRQMYSLGARYLTLTHNCDTPFATSATSVAAGEIDRGLSSLGHNLVQEMNRLGMLVDLSHVSPQTMRDVLKVAKAPVMFSHSGAFSISRHLRNAPDDVLQSLKLNDGVIMVCFVNDFLNKDHPDQTTIHDIADHIFHIANLIGWQHVGLGSDFDGTIDVPRGMEDTSKYPNLIQLLMKRGATDSQIRGLAGDNILRVWSKVEQHAKSVQANKELPVEEVWPGRHWFHDYDPELPLMFRDSKKERREAD